MVIVNLVVLGEVPPKMTSTTTIEEMLIARCRVPQTPSRVLPLAGRGACSQNPPSMESRELQLITKEPETLAQTMVTVAPVW